jgi:large subunit ribosomal protein L6
MSRIGKQPIDLPQGVQVTVSGNKITCKGPKGSLDFEMVEGITAKVEAGKVLVARAEDTRQLRAMHGTTRARVRNMVEGVSKGYTRNLEIVGVGYKAVLQGKALNLNVGFANTLVVQIPDGVTIQVPDPTHVNVSGVDKALVGRVAADIRAQRKPEPYKGKGVRYLGEAVRKKAGKAAAGAGAGAKK